MIHRPRPCPFCNGDPRIAGTLAGRVVYCTMSFCNLRGPVARTAKLAIEKWNRIRYAKEDAE